MKAVVSIFALACTFVFASTVLAADTYSQPLTRADCGKASMLWNEGANVCTESTSTATHIEPSTTFAAWNEGTNVCMESTSTAAHTESSTLVTADATGQPLTRADCGKAGMHWDEGANVCTGSTSAAVLGESKSESTPAAKGSSVLISHRQNQT